MPEAKQVSRYVAGLSTKLLLLTIIFVMVAEVLVFVPSVSNFRRQWLMERLAAAQIASLAAEAAPGGELPKMLRDELLDSAKVKAIAVKRADARVLVIEMDMPTEIDASYDLRNELMAQADHRCAHGLCRAGRSRHPCRRRAGLQQGRDHRRGDGGGAAEGGDAELRARHSGLVDPHLDHHRGPGLPRAQCAAGEADDQAHLEHGALRRAARGSDPDHQAVVAPRRDRHRRARALRHATRAVARRCRRRRGSPRSVSP